MGRRDNPNVDIDRRRAPQPLDRAFLEDGSNLTCTSNGRSPISSRKASKPWASSKRPIARQRSGIRAFFPPKQLALDERARNRRAIDSHHVVAAAGAGLVDVGGESLFARPRFPDEEHGGGRGRHLRGQFQCATDSGAAALDQVATRAGRDFLAQIHVLALEPIAQAFQSSCAVRRDSNVCARSNAVAIISPRTRRRGTYSTGQSRSSDTVAMAITWFTVPGEYRDRQARLRRQGCPARAVHGSLRRQICHAWNHRGQAFEKPAATPRKQIGEVDFRRHLHEVIGIRRLGDVHRPLIGADGQEGAAVGPEERPDAIKRGLDRGRHLSRRCEHQGGGRVRDQRLELKVLREGRAGTRVAVGRGGLSRQGFEPMSPKDSSR